MRYLIIILFITSNYLSSAQEICNNGIDDDHNGLIDLQDAACACKDSLPPLSYLRNASFEDNPSCPEIPGGGLNYIPYWGGGTYYYGPDFYNLKCEFKYYYTNLGVFKPPLPLPAGSGYIGLTNNGDFEKGSKGYAATCLENPLLSGLKYSFECYIGFSPDDTDETFFKSPVDLTLFGNPDCLAYPFTTLISRGCPLNIDLVNPNHNWVQLGTLKVFGKGNWVKARIDFTAPANIKAFLVGTNCFNYGSGYQSYFYADDFSLSEEKNFYFKTITVKNNCTGGIQLKAPPGVNARYQWYIDSIAIVGATDSFYTVPNQPNASGSYNVRLVFPNACIVSSPALINLSDINSLNIGKDTTLCSGEKLLLRSNVKNVQYQWQDRSADSTYLVQQSGNYVLKVTNESNCSFSDTINVKFKQCSDCAIEIPSAFTPNGDGKNDVFKVLTSCLLVNEFNLQVYNRWGQKIFETKEVTQGWEGNIKDKPLDSGTYIYQLQYKKYGTNTIVRKSGTVVLIR